MNNYVYIAMLLVVTSGCTVGKKYTEPALDLPVQYRDARTSADTASLGETPLHQFFNDPLLQQLIDSTIKKNYDLQLAIKNIEIADQLMKQSKLGYWPDVDAQITASTSRFSDNSLNSNLGVTHIENYSAGVGLSWEADIWGKIRMRKQAALSTYLETEEVKKAVQTRLVAEVAQGYYNLLSLDAQRDVSEKNLALRDSTLRIIKLQYTSGQVNALAVQQADAQKQAAELLVPALQKEITIQENALRVLSGELPSAIQLSAKLNDFNVPDEFSSGVPVEMVKYRPDVRAYELALQAANSRVGIAQANMYPSLVITASGGLNSLIFSSWFSIPASLFGLLNGSLTQPVFHRKELKTAHEIAKIEREKAVIQFRQSVLFAVEEISNALISVEKLKTQSEVATARAETLQNVTRNAMLLFKSGMANYLDVITAQATALQSQLDVLDTKRQLLNANVELYRSLGGGWK
ncbi:efflux transporter outer membrane subunit [Flavihumibacter profundi]|jgi:outer membrane protein, multidrug efflux system|uniref:efflux transporter outer membrane subunit n=1 Tax=Flavihumibacter profundi TaxID=2716883 RepID=UPI001CC4F6B7|nr:efflux transporter outer membrane subunit [Flavihumibacter profundi]MBZ5856622.1 efflux transporter outer membrane subunit [Flavihumibacter profundi]